MTLKRLSKLMRLFAIQTYCAGCSILMKIQLHTRKSSLCARNVETRIFRLSTTKKAALVAALFLSGCVSVRTVDIITVNASDNKVATDNTVKPVNNKLKSVCDALRQRLGDNAKLPPSC